MDRLENETFFTSKFKKLNQRFWYKRESWKYAKKIFGYKFDAWHISKTLMIFCICGAIANTFIQFCILGGIWILIFNTFYNKIFKA